MDETDYLKELLATIFELTVTIQELSKELELLRGFLARNTARVERLEYYLRTGKKKRGRQPKKEIMTQRKMSRIPTRAP